MGREERNKPMKIGGGIGQLIKGRFRRSWSVQLPNSVEVFESRSSDFSLLLERAFGRHVVERNWFERTSAHGKTRLGKVEGKVAAGYIRHLQKSY